MEEFEVAEVISRLILLVADVAELADALDSKSSIREDVWVRPPPSAPSKSTTCVDSVDMLLHFNT